MKSKNDLQRIFTGTQLSVSLLKKELKDNGIGAVIQNDHQSGLSAGFFGGSSSSIDLYIQESDLERAKLIVKAFVENRTD